MVHQAWHPERSPDLWRRTSAEPLEASEELEIDEALRDDYCKLLLMKIAIVVPVTIIVSVVVPVGLMSLPLPTMFRVGGVIVLMLIPLFIILIIGLMRCFVSIPHRRKITLTSGGVEVRYFNRSDVESYIDTVDWMNASFVTLDSWAASGIVLKVFDSSEACILRLGRMSEFVIYKAEIHESWE